MVNMEKIYAVKHYLHSSKIDRQYPYDFEDPFVIEEEKTVFETIDEDYDGIDYVQVYCNCHGNDVSSAKLHFSPTIHGKISILTVDSKDEPIDVDNDTVIEFKVDSNLNPTDVSEKLTGVQSIVLEFIGDAYGIEVYDIVFRTRDYAYTIKDLELAYEDGKNHVLRRLNDLDTEKYYKDIPKMLKRYVYMAGGAYAWLTRWEYESKPMKEPNSESNNYADRLLGQVDTALQKYLNTTNNNPEEDYINMTVAGASDCTWGIN